ncbi:hypothetical protein [Slackia heliotrinireducens]|nr:hypothetical protein [Slackia heliotrinireducens]
MPQQPAQTTAAAPAPPAASTPPALPAPAAVPPAAPASAAPPATALGVYAPPAPPAVSLPLDLSTLPTIRAIRSPRAEFVIALDTEFHYITPKGRERLMLTWQYAFAEPANPDIWHEVVFYAVSADKRLGFHRAIAYIMERFGIVGQLSALGATTCPEDGYMYAASRVWIVPDHDLHGAGWDAYDPDEKGRCSGWVKCKSFDEALDVVGDPAFKDEYEELVMVYDLYVDSLVRGGMGKKAAERQARGSHPARCKLKVDLETGEPVTLAGYRNEFGGFHRKGQAVPVTVVCHAAKADLTAYTDDADDYEKDMLLRVANIQGGLMTLQPYTANPHLAASWWRFYPLNVTIRDTMGHAPAKLKSLEALGEAVGVPKVHLPQGYSKDHMDAFLKGDPVAFFEYAAQDAVATLAYASAMYVENRAMPVTMSSAAAKSMRISMKGYFGITSNAEFDRVWRGLVREKGLAPGARGRLGPKSSLVPVNDRARILQEYARNAFKGGANGCSAIGLIDKPTTDVDACSAYPTAFSGVFDIDWEDPKSIVREWVREEPTLQDFRTPWDPAFAYVDDYRFPDDVPYPCIAMHVGDCIVFPRSLGDRDGVYVTGFEIWLALKLGAYIHIEHGYLGKYRLDDRGFPTHSMFRGGQQFVEDRATLKYAMENGQPELKVFEQGEKTMICSVYGKSAQNVIEKTSWNAMSGEMEDLGMSCITSPTHATVTTAAVRCILMAAMNELEMGGHRCYSFTTDGFITDADVAMVRNLSLFGLAPYLEALRFGLVGDGTVWEAKHRQEWFYNVTTRGNIAPYPKIEASDGTVLHAAGVCAHNSYISPYTPESLADRLYCLDAWLTRSPDVNEGKCSCTHGAWVTFRKLADKKLREDFYVEEDARRDLRMDFDMKRKPVETSLVTKRFDIAVTEDEIAAAYSLDTLTPDEYAEVADEVEYCRTFIGGRSYEVCNVDTVPFDTPEEFEFYRARARTMKCLRTESDWRAFFAKVHGAQAGVRRQVADWEWSRIMTCVMGHRLGLWTIPDLDDPSKTVDEKCQWINGFNQSKRAFKASNWKDARKQNRQAQMLPRDDVADLLDAMGAVEAGCIVVDAEEVD